jgi:hypothetical protein
LTIVVYAEGESEKELAHLRYLVVVTAMKNFYIYGNSMLLLGN